MIMRSIFTQASVQLHFLCFCFHSVTLFFFFFFFFGFLHHCHCETTPLQEDIMEGNIGQKCDWIVPYCFVFGDAMNLPVRYYVVPGRMLYRNSDGIISYSVTQLILRHAIISYPMMTCRTQ